MSTSGAPSRHIPRQRIGPWRLLDIVTATMPLRSGSFSAAVALPEFGPPDVHGPDPEPATELPGSNLDERERRAAVAREAARRARSPMEV